MADGIYVGMSAATARLAQLDAIADNLANVESPGFKGVRAAFASFLPPGAQSDKVLSGAVATTVDMSPGTSETTDLPTDVIPDGDSFLGVQMGGGKMGYTRNGHIVASADGVLQIAGLPVLDDQSQPIVVPPQSDVAVEPNGDVRASGQVVATIGLWSSQGGAMDKVGPALLAPSAGTQMSQDTTGSLRVGELELGNVSALESTVAMIGAQRNYDLAMQAIQTYHDLDHSAVQVGTVR
jgi:flagellar basal-body rod protein FlgF